MFTRNTINDVVKALKQRIPAAIIRWTLQSEGYPANKADTIIRWAQRHNEANMATYHLRQWSVGELSSHYTAPEAKRICLHGFRDQEEKPVRTSAIIKVEGKKVHTENSIYILEDIDPEYLGWMKENGIEYDPENPIKVKTL